MRWYLKLFLLVQHVIDMHRYISDFMLICTRNVPAIFKRRDASGIHVTETYGPVYAGQNMNLNYNKL